MTQTSEPLPTFIFTHVPKTAGMSFGPILTRQFPRGAVLPLSMQADRFQASIDAFRDLPEDRRRAIRCIYGHVPFGLHEWVPGEVIYLAFVRDPVERALSMFHYLGRNERLRAQLGYPPSAGSSLESFLAAERDRGQTDLQVRVLSGRGMSLDRVMPPYEVLPDDALGSALENLERHYGAVGIAGRFDESLVLMQLKFGWRRVTYRRRNTGRRRPSRGAFPPAAIERIREDNAADAALFEAATARHEAIAAEGGPAFVEACTRFARANRRFQVTDRLVFGAARFVRWRILGRVWPVGE